MEAFIAWMVAFMVAVAPPGRRTYIPEAEETREAALERYDAIARDIQTVVMDPNENVVTSGQHARIRMSAIILSLMLHESGFRRDVDFGLGKYARGDGGRSWCLMQINVGSGQTLRWNQVKHRFMKDGDPPSEEAARWYGRDLVEDRSKCVRTGLHTVIGTACRQLPVMEWLRAYASGSCGAGSAASRTRMALAIRWFDQHRPAFNDNGVWQALQPAAPANTNATPSVALPADPLILVAGQR